MTAPTIQLAGFKRVTLAAGETRTVTITLTPRAFEIWNGDMHRVVEPGPVEIRTGSNSVDLQSATLMISQGAEDGGS